jgi:hypothetical protein
MIGPLKDRDGYRTIMRVKGSRISLVKYGARQVRKGITVKVKKSGGRKLVRHAFIVTMPSGHVGVFTRDGRKRLPVSVHYGPGIPQLFYRKQTMSVMRRVHRQEMIKTFLRRYEAQLRRMGR